MVKLTLTATELPTAGMPKMLEVVVTAFAAATSQKVTKLPAPVGRPATGEVTLAVNVIGPVKMPGLGLALVTVTLAGAR